MNPIEKYQQAVNELKASIAHAEQLVKVVSTGATILSSDWKHAMISGVQGGFLPETALARDRPSISGREWPTAQQLADALQRYHKARSELQNAWDAIPGSQRDVVQRPEAYF